MTAHEDVARVAQRHDQIDPLATDIRPRDIRDLENIERPLADPVARLPDRGKRAGLARRDFETFESLAQHVVK